MPVLDEYSVTTLRLTLLSQGNTISVATGFLSAHQGAVYLVTNWHVISGRHPGTGEPLNRMFAVPDTLTTSLPMKGQLGTWSGEARVGLYRPDGSPLWQQHPRGREVDVAAIRLHPFPDNCEAYTLPRPTDTANMAIKVGMDAFVLGYPKGMSHQGVLPIWKRASIATEPDIPHNNSPMFLVDTATREGMSGAPVLLRASIFQTIDGITNLTAGMSSRFVGIYSGRYGAEDEFGAQLGRVWLKSTVDDVLQLGVPGNI